MTSENVIKLIQGIVEEAQLLKDKYILGEKKAPVNYACIFSQTEKEFNEFLKIIQKMGPQVDTTSMGPIFDIGRIETKAGRLRVFKLRLPDIKRPERGDADFTVKDYVKFKKDYLFKTGFNLLIRPKFEMIELSDPTFNVLAYFSSIPMNEQLGLK